jgi:glycine/D-amino acid oxidase-like deaminating enzyme
MTSTVTQDEHGSYPDVAARSPWIAQLLPDGPPRPLERDLSTDVVVVGAGVAGVSTAFWTLRDTSEHVVLLECDRVGRGATGRNAGQLTTYFERPLVDIAEEFGEALACQAQADIEAAHGLLDLMVAETGATVRVERFVGHMGMFTLNHAMVHLGNNALRHRNGLQPNACIISEDAEWLDGIPDDLARFYSIASQERVNELLETPGVKYRGVLSTPAGCANSGLLVQQVLAWLEATYPERFTYADNTLVDRVVVGSDEVTLHTGRHAVTASEVVLCTNGFDGHRVVDPGGEPIELVKDQHVVGTIGYMAAFVEDRMRAPGALSFIRNEEIGGATPYVYITRRTYDRPDGAVTLSCMGGPEWPILEPWSQDLPFPGSLLTEMDDTIRPFAQPNRPPRQPYDFAWHGLMGYTPGKLRVVGRHPERPALLYNLGCNGIGFLPSVYGGRRVSRLLAGEDLPASIFEPRTEPAG